MAAQDLPAMKHVMFGTLLIATLESIPVILVTVVGAALLLEGQADLLLAAFLSVLSSLAAHCVIALLERPLDRRNPVRAAHGMLPTLIEIVVPIVVVLLVFTSFLGLSSWVVGLLSGTLGFLPSTLLSKPWKPDITRAEHRANARELKAVMIEDILEHGQKKRAKKRAREAKKQARQEHRARG